jgi:hypothetical protein
MRWADLTKFSTDPDIIDDVVLGTAGTAQRTGPRRTTLDHPGLEGRCAVR